MSVDVKANTLAGPPGARDKRPIDTIWFDVSALLLVPPGHISGIPRTIRNVYQFWRQNSWTTLRFVAIIPNLGLAEVNPDSIFLTEPDAVPTHEQPLPAESSDPARSRYWYIPYPVRHRLRSLRKQLRDRWAAPQEPPANPDAGYHLPYRPESILRLLEGGDLGPRDLVFSPGALWMVPHVNRTLSRAKARHRFQFASIVYDLIPFFTPHFSPPGLVRSVFEPSTEAQLRESDLILAISECTRRDVLKYARQNDLAIAPVEVFTLGSDIVSAADADREPPARRRPYVLSVGSVEVRKNHLGMYHAWRKLARTLEPDQIPDLVLAGKVGWQGESILYLIQNDPLVKDRIVFHEAPTDPELDRLYRDCLFTLYPSHYEGWGLPVEESLIYGKLCITATASSLPEVGGPFVDYVDSEDIDGLGRAVVRALDPDYRRLRETLIRDEFRPNTWARTARQLQDILHAHYRLPAAAPRAEAA